MRTTLAGLLAIVVSAVPARAQESSPGEPLPRLREMRIVELPGATGPVAPAQQAAEQDPSDDDDGGRDSLRDGTLTGLIVGGVVGVFLAARCGHPECGPLFSFSAGIGAAVGVAIDAMFSERSQAPVERTHAKRAPFDRAVAVGVRKTW